MHTFIVVIHVLAAIILVLTVLLQAGKGAGMGAAFGGSSSSVFGSRGPATLISKITCGAAVIFMITSINLSLLKRGTGADSLMSTYTESAPAPASPASPATPGVASPAASPSEAAPAQEAPAAE